MPQQTTYEDGGLLFVGGAGSVRSVHVNVVGKNSRAWLPYLQFHALLLDDAEARECCQSAKRGPAQAFDGDRDGYTAAKSAVVDQPANGRPPPHAG